MTMTDDLPVRRESGTEEGFVVDVEGFEGPLDALLTLARAQKVDLRQVSIVELADQYLAFITDARRRDLDLAAEYLVMAAWLAYLKSRLLLPDLPAEAEPTGEEMAAALTFQLERLEAMRGAAARLAARPKLGRDRFARGQPEPPPERTETVVRATLYSLLRAYAASIRRRESALPLRIEMSALDSIDAALERLSRGLGQAPGWESLMRYLPEGALEGLRQGSLSARSSMAATFGASLELARQGCLVLRQNRAFGPIYLKAADAPPPGESDT